jgi:hypothetical protein
VGFKQMLRRVQINGDPKRRSLRFFAALADIVRWPFERAAWAIERGLLWPLRERFAGHAPSGRSVGAGALVAVAGAAILAGALLVSGGDQGVSEPVAVVATPATHTAAAQPHVTQPQGPALHGVAPDFGVDKGVGVAKTPSAEAPATGSEDSGIATEAGGDASQPQEDTAASASSTKPVPAGPAAMQVARRFSEAFVFYEIGERPVRAKTVFGETATPELATALGERPPRLPADATVPKARVVNLVPGPRAGKAYTVSVSLLRVGLTSELRLELNRKNGSWVITDVRG